MPNISGVDVYTALLLPGLAARTHLSREREINVEQVSMARRDHPYDFAYLRYGVPLAIECFSPQQIRFRTDVFSQPPLYLSLSHLARRSLHLHLVCNQSVSQSPSAFFLSFSLCDRPSPSLPSPHHRSSVVSLGVDVGRDGRGRFTEEGTNEQQAPLGTSKMNGIPPTCTATDRPTERGRRNLKFCAA